MNKTLLCALILTCANVSAQADPNQQTVSVGPYMAQIVNDGKSLPIGKPIVLDIFLMDAKSMAPIGNLKLAASLSMPSMAGMSLDRPQITAGKVSGHYDVGITLPHPGKYRLVLSVTDASAKKTAMSFDLDASDGGRQSESKSGMQGMSGMETMQMKGSLGPWPANRESSGTSWQPDSSPMFMKMLPGTGGFEVGAMGTLQGGYTAQGGPRGAKSFFSNSMIMFMGRRQVGTDILGLDFMTSLDPIINGEKGVPNLFQTGETAHGTPLVDRQHPHNLFSELAASYSHPLSRSLTAFVYGGPVGEPALGNSMFMHRPSGMEVPEAPISHHWFDSTHISFGVATIGLVVNEKLKLEGSLFNGQEPGENRYTIGPVALNSASGRLTYNPSNDWSLSSSYGYLKSPEALSPGLSQHRLTASATYSHNMPNGDNLSATAYFGERTQEGTSASNAWLAEATLYHGRDALFARIERVDEDELFNIPAGTYTVNKLLLGDVHSLFNRDQLDFALGVYAGVYSFPESLTPYYGKNPLTLGVFIRIRPTKM